MQIEKHDLISAADKIGIPNNLSEKLWDDLSREHHSKKLDFAKILYYFGALIVIAAMSWFMVDAIDSYTAEAVFFIALSYLLFFFLVGSYFWNIKKLEIPGGLFITLSVCMVPIVVYIIQKWIGFGNITPPEKYTHFFSFINSEWFVMEIATVIFGFIALYFYRFPFLTMPIAFALWFLSMDITPFFFGKEYSFENFKITSIVFGIFLLIAAYIIDISQKKDFAFWLYLFGALTFWGGLSFLEISVEYKRFFYLIINLGLIVLSILLQRTIFLIFGGLGVFVYISTLFFKYFSDSLNFPIILSFIGVLFVLLGVLYHKNQAKIESILMSLLPDHIQDWLPRR